jgi:hypothetical protein
MCVLQLTTRAASQHPHLLWAACPSAGDWLLLKNLHLVAAWLPALEKELHALAAKGGEGGGVAAGFRLVLTTEAHQHFPSTLLENCLKVSQQLWKGCNMCGCSAAQVLIGHSMCTIRTRYAKHTGFPAPSWHRRRATTQPDACGAQ